jgi:hypothetical protein
VVSLNQFFEKRIQKQSHINIIIIIMFFTKTENYLLEELPNYEKYKNRVGENDFFIPQVGEYHLLFKNNYTLSQLKEICKFYKLNRTGNKNKLMTMVYNYLYYSKYATVIQKYIRGYNQRKLNNLRGPGFLNRKLCVNNCDFFTLEKLEKIPSKQFYSFKDEDNFIYGFDIISLSQLLKNEKSPENPYNRKKFHNHTIEKLKLLISKSKKFKSKIETKLIDDSINIEKELELRIISLFQFINNLGNYTDHSWFLKLSNIQLVRFCRELYDIWNHRAQISEETKLRIYPTGNPFRSLSIHSINFNNNLYETRKSIVRVMENLSYNGITDDDKNLGAYYILTALTLQSFEAAEALPWLYQSVM